MDTFKINLRDTKDFILRAKDSENNKYYPVFLDNRNCWYGYDDDGIKIWFEKEDIELLITY